MDIMDVINAIMKILGYICIFIIILYLAHITSKYLAKKNEFINKNRSIKIKERLLVNKDKELILITYKDREYLIGISQDKFTKIDTFENKDDISEEF
ncbi:flagellar biosynthetic protein FliO [Tepidibacter aestuarii]|uniref:flagellar biosynthetic protein FliO n=1 Tax=Tepidibacter aestuarii TaxID=2925782 RepID=UPI0020BF4BAE|nr:flagellar biosynthetic protein FliO [Tepidibacter aestuarii]CAH2214011.1 Flagellar protein FliO/FliZ [Tepidibacter aestuarii]